MYSLLRPAIFRLDPERAHGQTLKLLRLPGCAAMLGQFYQLNDPRLRVDAIGLSFKNPVGLAAGYDKNGIAAHGMACLGFGHIELGTVTLKPQAGNPRPRVHRVPEASALINSMGFPNDGVEQLLLNVRAAPALRRSKGARTGINIGKSKDTPLERAADDYSMLLRQVYAHADYVAVNISSPNTLGLRQLQARAAMEELLTAVAAERRGHAARVPILVKIAPDLSESELDDVAAAVEASGMDGIIATNTTLNRAGVAERHAALKGGLSGAPLRARANEVMRYLSHVTKGRMPLIGAGGIMSAADALERLRAGAWLVQVYTGLIYAGPGLVHSINRELVLACEREGAKSVWELARQ